MKQETNKTAGPEAGGTSGQSVHRSKFRQKSQQEQTAAVFRTEIWEAPYIPHTHGASGCGKNETDRAGKTLSLIHI